ncbi:hypothetical protein [Polyangium mundeleinium]|uniref:Uncharacterized protein n=1 Tax=Polyangium mundeleinium TaxID=2995306 RepID=A0ABT5EM26_9BACT|nr:hypothetical protein [Polyangium mundeleinium]MDC0741761.1 hypothetical protein [Polyangium mundeleinium]
MTDSTKTHRRGISCQITAFEILDAPTDPDVPPRKWMAVATAHVYDPNMVMPPLTPAQTVLAGETMRVISSRSYADTEAEAMAIALQGLLFELTASGFSATTT